MTKEMIMVETQSLEACAECLVTVATGTGEEWRVETLLRKFGGNLLINETSSIVTFRPCGCCGIEVAGVRYAAVATLRTGEDA
jgi:hypothetical protein